MVTKSPSLLSPDARGTKIRDWYVCYFPRTPHFWFAHLWKQGYRHVELTRPLYYGPGPQDVMWLNLLPTFETLDVEVSYDPRPPWVKAPDAIIQKVTATRPYWAVRSWFDIGPPSCVEIAKAALGINAFWVRTPWQLHKYIAKRNGVIVNGRRRK
jgi:hypothetical protein